MNTERNIDKTINLESKNRSMKTAGECVSNGTVLYAHLQIAE